MPDEFKYDVFLSHSAKDKAVVRAVAERLRKDGLKVWFDEWVLKPADNIPAKIEEGLEHSRVLVLCMSANAFGSDWAQLEAGTFRFRDPLNKECRFIPLRLDDAPIKGSLAQFLYINWRPANREQEYAKLLEACRPGKLLPNGDASFEAIWTLCLNLILDDQLDSPQVAEEYRYSWGRSTIDYCLLATRYRSWPPADGSITQTAWALMALADVSRMGGVVADQCQRAAIKAQAYVNRYISGIASSAESYSRATSDQTSQRQEEARHAATALLADLLLEEIVPRTERQRPEGRRLLGHYADLLRQLAEFLDHPTRGPEPLTADYALFALYPMLVQTLLERKGPRSQKEQPRFLSGLVRIWLDAGSDVERAAQDLLDKVNPDTSDILSRVHLWGMVADAALTIASTKHSRLAQSANSLLARMRRRTEQVCNDINSLMLPVFTADGYVEPWGLFALTLCYEPVRRDTLRMVARELTHRATPPVLGACTPIWSRGVSTSLS